MHKRAVNDVSSGFRHIFRRHRTGPSGQPKVKARKPYPPRNEDDTNFPVSQQLRKVISPQACDWLEGKPIKVERGSPSNGSFVFTQSSSSNEKIMFDSLDPNEDAPTLPGGEDAGMFVGEGQRIPAGSLVEIRRTDTGMNGVVLYSVLMGRRWHVYSLVSNGEVWQHHEHDVTFQLPDFISKKLAEESGIGPTARTESELTARVDILTTLRTFEKRLEYHSHSTPEIARSKRFYDLVAHPNPKAWVNITTQDAAEKLYGKSSISTQELFAVQSYLFDSGLHFVSESRRFLQRPSFWVRPRQEVADIEVVVKMVLNRSPVLNTFIEKARKVITASRRRTADGEGRNEPPSRRPLDGMEWTEEDRTIFRFFVASMQNRRVIQMDPFLVPMAHILKALKMYNKEEYDSTTTHAFLSEMGILSPWEEVNTRDDIQRDSVLPNLKPSKSTPIIPHPLGSDDFYSHDIVESIRHDFGDLPVYVVDDWDAEELDDGISIERIPSDPEHSWLHVHVADPTTLLPPTHRLARHAMKVNSSKYYVHRTIPMLDRDAGFHRFSLGNTPGYPDVVLTFSAKVNLVGEIVDYKVRPAVVRNVRPIKYDEVDALLGMEINAVKFPFGHPGVLQGHTIAPVVDSAMIDDLRLLLQVSQNLQDMRVKNGALVFTLPKAEVKVEPRPFPRELMGPLEDPAIFRGFPKMTYSVTDTLEQGSRNIVAECMKTAGRVASRFCRDRGVPALRRTVGPLTSELRGGIDKVMAMRGPGGVIDVYTAFLERVSAPPGQYSTKPEMHSLLGIPDGEGYLKVTSPLRRFGDLFVHWQIKHALLAAREHSSPVLFDEEWLVRMAVDMNVRELDVKRTEAIQQTFWAHLFLLRWMNDPARDQREHDPLRSLVGRIVESATTNSRTNEKLCQVYIPEIGLNGRVRGWPSEDERGLGDNVDVRINAVLLGPRPSLDLDLR